MTAAASPQFNFQVSELPRKLQEFSGSARTGYWRFSLNPGGGLKLRAWHLAVVQERVVFSGTDEMTWKIYLKALQRFLPRLRGANAQATIEKMEQESTSAQLSTIGIMLGKLEATGLTRREESIQAIRLKVLSDLDQFLFAASGHAEFVTDFDLVSKAQVTGFKLEDLLVLAKERRDNWRNLSTDIPSMQAIPMLNVENLERSSLAAEQKQQIRSLAQSGKSLEVIADALSKDPLETARLFSNLVRNQFVTLQLPAELADRKAPPKVFIVDDSPLLVREFKQLVSKWGYQVFTCLSATEALKQIQAAKPDAIFLDINMPGASGFDLIKQIRRQPDLAELPLVLLSAEKTLSNQFRAQWVNSKFMAKPRTPQEIHAFQGELLKLLQEIAPF
jgi:CheY-like chemotaxis protein